MSSKIKVSQLFNILRNDKIDLLTEFFYYNPGFNIEERLTSGKRRELLREAMDNNSINCTMFLLTRMNTNILSKYIHYAVSSYSKREDIFNSFITVVQLKALEENNNDIIGEIILEVTRNHWHISEEVISKIVNDNKEYLKNKLSTDSYYKNRLEQFVADNKISVIRVYIQFYEQNNIDGLDHLYTSIIFTNNRSAEKMKMMIKYFRERGLNTRVSMFNQTNDYIQSIHKYSIFFLLLITNHIDLLKIRGKTEVVEDFSFEEEFFNMMNEPNECFWFRNNIFIQFIQSYKNKERDMYVDINLFGVYINDIVDVNHKNLKRFMKLVQYYTPKIFECLDQINDSFKDKKKTYYHTDVHIRKNKECINLLRTLPIK